MSSKLERAAMYTRFSTDCNGEGLRANGGRRSVASSLTSSS